MDVCVVGSCGTDLTCYSPNLPKEGETIIGDKFRTDFGGKGGNQCVTAARLGAKVAIVAKLGNDSFGQDYKQNLAVNNVNTDFVTLEDGTTTGVAAITVASNGANCIVVVPGANYLLSTENVTAASEVIKSAKVLVCQNEIRPEVSLTAIALASSYQVKTIYNPAPASKDLRSELFSTPDIFCPNETEAELLTGLTVSTIEEAKQACSFLIKTRSCKMVIITLGAQGAVFQANDDEEVVHVPTEKVDALDTVGAGDSFIGSLAYFLSKRPDLSMKDMIRRASQVAGYSVRHPGAQNSFPTAEQLPSHVFQ